MEVVIKWDNLEGEYEFNERLIALAKQYQDDKDFKQFNFLVTLEPNSRHLIYLDIDTKNEGERLSILSNSYNLENSFEILTKEAKKVIGSYNAALYEKNKEKERKWAQQAKENRARDLEEQKRKIEEKEKRIKARKSALEKQKLTEQEKKNAEILKKLEKNRLESEKEDQEILAELEEQKKKYEEAKKIEAENKEKLQKHMATLKFEVVAEDLEEDYEKQQEIKAEKEKLLSLQSEENECLVIIEKMKELERTKLDLDKFTPGEPFLLGSCYFYTDGQGKIFKANEEGAWEECTEEDAAPFWEESKQPQMQEYEWLLIQARKRRKLHLKEMADGKELIAELEASRSRKKNLEKEQKENIKKLKDNYAEIHKQTEEQTKAHIKPIKIEIAETHPANEPFLTDKNVYAYHDGEGRYYISDESGNWSETTKDYVYGQSTMAENKDISHGHKVGEQFKNLLGDTFYFDGSIYYKLVGVDWEVTTEAEANDMDLSKKDKAKLEKQKAKEERKTKKLEMEESKSDKSEDKSSSEAKSGETQQWQDENGTWWYLDEQGNYFYSDGTNWVPYSADGSSSSGASASAGGAGQQWQDDNGTWWYLDEQGNYFYSDGTNWVPYQG